MKCVGLLATVVAVAVSALSLNACTFERFNLGPASITRQAGEPVVAICAEIEVAGIRLSVENPQASAGWETVWDASGSSQFSVGDTVTAAQLAERFTEVRLSSEPDADTDGLELIVTKPNDGAGFTASFDLEEVTLDVGTGWLHPDGSVSEDPCAAG